MHACVFVYVLYVLRALCALRALRVLRVSAKPAYSVICSWPTYAWTLRWTIPRSCKKASPWDVCCANEYRSPQSWAKGGKITKEKYQWTAVAAAAAAAVYNIKQQTASISTQTLICSGAVLTSRRNKTKFPRFIKSKTMIGSGSPRQPTSLICSK